MATVSLQDVSPSVTSKVSDGGHLPSLNNTLGAMLIGSCIGLLCVYPSARMVCDLQYLTYHCVGSTGLLWPRDGVTFVNTRKI